MKQGLHQTRLKKSWIVGIGLLVLTGLSGCSSHGFFRNRANDYLTQPVIQTPTLKTPASMQTPVLNPAYPIPAGVSSYPAEGVTVMTPPGLDQDAKTVATTMPTVNTPPSLGQSQLQLQALKVKLAKLKAAENTPEVSPPAHLIQRATQPTASMQTPVFPAIQSHLQRANTGAGLLILETRPEIFWPEAPYMFQNSGAQFEGLDQREGFIFFKAHPGAPTQLIHVEARGTSSSQHPQKLLLTLYDAQGQPDLSQKGFQLLEQIQRNLSQNLGQER